jgi:hypothetical protein
MTWSNDEKQIVEKLNKEVILFEADNLIYEGKNYSSYDAHNTYYTAEIKKRNFESYHKYAQEGLILEKAKYDKLIEKADKAGTQALYINLFTDDKVWIWNLSELKDNGYDFKWQSKRMNKATFHSKWNKVEKEVALLGEEIRYA